MANKPIEGKPAFPTHPIEHDRYWHEGEPGLSERRYYIAAALSGICANPNRAHWKANGVATEAIKIADAVMQQLYPQPKEPQQ